MSSARIAAWLVAGGLGTFAILSGWNYYVATQVPVKLRPGGTVDTALWDRGYATATGTWVDEEAKDSQALQYTNLACFRADNTCRSATAEIVDGTTLSLNTVTYKVTRWTETTLIFANTDAPCVEYTYTISRTNQRVVGTRTPKRSTEEACPNSEEVVQLTLVDGARVTRAQEQAANARAQPVAWASLAALWVCILFGGLRRSEPDPDFAEA